MTLQVFARPVSRAGKKGQQKRTEAHQEAFAPQAEDHLPRVRDATGVLVSRPRALCYPSSNLVLLLQQKTSYYSGITDACITFVAAPRHVQLVLNTSPSKAKHRER